ncbi:hypothetical protein WMF30_10955 [Sorangium sp. So ce134]
MLALADLRALAEQLIVYDDRDPRRVTVYGSAVGVSRGLSRRDAITVRAALRVALRRMLSAATGAEEPSLEPLIERLVVTQAAEEHGRHDVLVCGSELVGQEDSVSAESRALSMRAVLVAELQRAIDDTMPPTERRSSPPVSVVGR